MAEPASSVATCTVDAAGSAPGVVTDTPQGWIWMFSLPVRSQTCRYIPVPLYQRELGWALLLTATVRMFSAP